MIDTPQAQYQHLIDEALETMPADLVQRLRIMLHRASGHAPTAWHHFSNEMVEDPECYPRFDAWLEERTKSTVPYEFRRRPN